MNQHVKDSYLQAKRVGVMSSSKRGGNLSTHSILHMNYIELGFRWTTELDGDGDGEVEIEANLYCTEKGAM